MAEKNINEVEWDAFSSNEKYKKDNIIRCIQKIDHEITENPIRTRKQGLQKKA